MQVVLQSVESRLYGIGHLLLDRLCGRWPGWDLRGRERVSVNERVPRGSSFDLAQAYKIPALEVPVPVLELPEGRVWRSSVEHVAHCSKLVRLDQKRARGRPTFVKTIHVQLSNEGRDVGMLEI